MSDEDPPAHPSPTRRVALGAIGVATVAAAVGISRAIDADAEPVAGGAASPPSGAHAGDLKAIVQADLTRAEAAPIVAPAPAVAPHPDDPHRRPDTLANRAMTAPRPARVLYTWTTAEQIAALRAGGDVLHRAFSARHGDSVFDQALRDAPEHPLAVHLRAPSNQFRRFAWPYPWATVMGWPNEKYGDRLLRIELRPCAIPALSVTARSSIRGSFGGELIGTQLRWSGAVAPVDQVGAVFHTHRNTQRGLGVAGTGSYTADGATLREYVLFSQAHLARVSHGDAACRAAIEADLACLTRWIDDPPWGKPFHVRSGTPWPTAVQTPQDAWRANLAFVNAAYQPRPAALRAIRATLTQALAAQGPAWSRG